MVGTLPADPPAQGRTVLLDACASADEQLSVIRECLAAHYDTAFVQDPQLAPLACLTLEDGVCDRVVAAAHLPAYTGFSYFDKPDDDVLQQTYEALLFRHAEKVVAPSTFAADVLLRVHRLDPSDVEVLALGAPEVTVEQRDAAHDSPLVVVSVGRIAKVKGLRDLSEIAATLEPEAARFVHIGSAMGTAYRHDLDDARIEVLGQLAHVEVLRRLRAADVVISTSMYETFGLAVLEGMSSGAVPLAFDCGALSELVDDGVSGILVAPGDNGAAAEAVRALHQDRALLSRLRQGALRAARRFTWQTHVARLRSTLFPV